MPGQPANARIVGQGLLMRKTNGDALMCLFWSAPTCRRFNPIPRQRSAKRLRKKAVTDLRTPNGGTRRDSHSSATYEAIWDSALMSSGKSSNRLDPRTMLTRCAFAI